jgi:hypothetical protein
MARLNRAKWPMKTLGSGEVECQRLAASAAGHPHGVVHAQADGGGCRFRSTGWPPSPGRWESVPGPASSGGDPGPDGTRASYTFQSGSIRSGSNGARDPCE